MEFAGSDKFYLQGYKSGVLDARKAIVQIIQNDDPLNLRIIDQVLKDLIKNLDDTNER